MSDFYPVLFFVILAFGLVIYSRLNSQISGVPLPPGPPAHWLFGNKFPASYTWRQFKEWTEEYGPVFTLRRGNTVTIVIGRQQAAIDIMEKEGAHLVDRPLSIAGGETLSGGMRMLLKRSGDQLKKYRRALHAQLQPKMAEEYEPIQMDSAKNVILDILGNPDQHQFHAKRYAASVIMSLTYGKTTPTSYSDPEAQQVNKCLTRLGKVIRPGAYLVDSYPVLRYIPGYLDELRAFHLEELELFKGQLDVVRGKMAKNEARPSFAKYLVERQKEYELSDNEIAYLAGSMFGAGSDTTAAAVSFVIMAAACYPEAQARVQEQLDMVVGRDKLPTFGDQEMLNQITAFVWETYRWRPVSAGGFAHRATQDIIWKNYRIPAGASVIANHWALARDPDIFPEPEKFDPQRWLNSEGCMREDLKFYNFGFGRRVCPGLHVANRSLFINTALLLWAFNISQDPAEKIDTNAVSDTANVHPMPFKVRFEPRVHAEKLREMVESHEG